MDCQLRFLFSFLKFEMRHKLLDPTASLGWENMMLLQFFGLSERFNEYQVMKGHRTGNHNVIFAHPISGNIHFLGKDIYWILICSSLHDNEIFRKHIAMSN